MTAMKNEIIDSLAKGTNALGMRLPVVNDTFSINGWTYIAIIELVIIIVYVVTFVMSKRKTNFKSSNKQKAVEEPVDFNNIVNSAFHSSELYKSLIVKCHPDRFPDNEEKNARALEIFQLITKNKNNFKALEELKERAVNELGINI